MNGDGKKYVNGKLASGVINGIYYKSGVPGTGTVSGIYYVNGNPANGTYSKVLYKNGAPANGKINGLLYKDGVQIYEPTLNDLLLIDNKVYRDNFGNPYTGTDKMSDDTSITYKNGVRLYWADSKGKIIERCTKDGVYYDDFGPTWQKCFKQHCFGRIEIFSLLLPNFCIF